MADAVGTLLVDDDKMREEAVSLGYDLIEFARMCTAVRCVAMDAVVGASLEYAYELAAWFLEVYPKTVYRWFRGLRSKQYFVHMTGEMKSKLVNEFYLANCLGHNRLFSALQRQ